MTRKSLETNSSHFFFPVQGEVAARSVAGSVRSTRRWASLRQHVAANEGGKPRVELLLDPPGSKPSTPSSPQPHTPNTPRTPHTPSRKSNWEVIEHFTGAPRPSIVTVSWHRNTMLLNVRNGPRSLFFLFTLLHFELIETDRIKQFCHRLRLISFGLITRFVIEEGMRRGKGGVDEGARRWSCVR